MSTVLQIGKNYRLQVGTGSGQSTFVNIGGEGTLTYSTTPDKIDAASKDDGDYKVEVYGQMSGAISVQGIVKLPDIGIAALETARKTAGTTIPVEIVNTTTGTPVPVFTCVMAVGNFKFDGQSKSAASYSFDLSYAAAPTIDSLFGG